MATKVHDQDDQDFAEIDLILAQAKQELRRDRCRDRKLRRNMNLSDIPENYAHVPSLTSIEATSRFNTRPVSLDTSQPDYASRDRSRDRSRHLLGLIAPVKWLRGYLGCLMAAQDSNCDVGTLKSCGMASGPEYAFLQHILHVNELAMACNSLIELQISTAHSHLLSMYLIPPLILQPSRGF